MDYSYRIFAGASNSAPNFTTLQAAWNHAKANDPTGSGTNGRVAANSTIFFKIDGFLSLSTTTCDNLDTTTNANALAIITSYSNAFNSAVRRLGAVTSYDGAMFGDQLIIGTNAGAQPFTFVQDLVLTNAIAGYPVVDMVGAGPIAQRGAVRRCILRNSASTSPTLLKIYVANVFDCVGIMTSPGGVFITNVGLAPDPASVDGCTFVSLGGGAVFASNQNDPMFVVRNTYVGGATTFGATFGAGSVGNSTDQASGWTGTTGTLYNVALSTTNFLNVTSGTEDLRVQTSSVLKTTGATRLSSQLDDIFKSSRSTTTTIGAHAAEFVPTAPTVTTQPSSQTVTAPATATFTAVFANSPDTYQWQVSTDSGSTWANVSGGSGGTTTAYTTPATSSGDTGKRYRCTASNAGGSVTTDGTAALTVNTAAVAPAVTTQPASQSVTTGATATFTAAFSGSPTPTYQWQRSTDSGSTWTNISGATAASYTTPATTVSGGTANNGDRYRCGATNSAGGPVYTNGAATLTVAAAGTAPSITTQPTSQTVTAGATATFTVAASGSGTLAYQWQRNSSNISGATSVSYTTAATTVSGGTANNGDVFRCVVTGDTSPPATSNGATLTVNASSTYGFTAGPCFFNSNSGPQLNKAFSWSLIYGTIGAYASAGRVDGTGTTDPSTGVITISGLATAGAADFHAKDVDGGIYYQRVTAA